MRPSPSQGATWALAVGAFVALPLLAHAADPRPFYAAKSITMVVGQPTGGAADAYARLLARYLPEHLAGAPSIVVENLPGAGGLKAVMYLNSAPVDGTVMATFSSGLIDEALTDPARVPSDFRSFSWIGNISEDVRVCYVWGQSGVARWQDLKTRAKPLFLGASAPGAAGTADTRMLQKLFGIRIREVQGYAGSADKRLAVERGEIDGECAGWSALPEDWLRDHKINVLLRLSPTLVPGMDAKLPFGGDLLTDVDDRAVYDFLTAPERLGRLFMVSAKVPGARTAALRAAFTATVADPQFRAEAAKEHLIVAPMTGAEVEMRIHALYATPPRIIARAKAIVGP